MHIGMFLKGGGYYFEIRGWYNVLFCFEGGKHLSVAEERPLVVFGEARQSVNDT